MRSLVEQDHRVLADQGFEHARTLARVKHVRWRHEQLPDLVRVGQDHERRLERQLHRDALAVLLAQTLQRSRRALPGRDQLERTRHGRSGRKFVPEVPLLQSLLAREGVYGWTIIACVRSITVR